MSARPIPLLILLTALVLAAFAVADAAPGAADVRKDFLEFNACGKPKNEDGSQHECHHYDNPDDGAPPKTVAEAIADSILGRSTKPDAVMLNEMCHRQFEELKTKLSAGDWAMDGAFAVHQTGIESCPGDSSSDNELGIAVLVRGTVDDSVTHRHPFTHQIGGESRQILCVKVNWGDGTRVCSTHLTYKSTDGCPDCPWHQADEVKDHVQQKYLTWGTPVVVGGDFNAAPTASPLNPLYDNWVNPDGSGSGFFKEVDMYNQDATARRVGEATHGDSSGNKIDYIFVNSGKWDVHEDRTGDVSGDATSSPYSDHDPLWGHAILDTPSES